MFRFRLTDEQRAELAVQVYSVKDLEGELGCLYHQATNGEAFLVQSTCRLMVQDEEGDSVGLGTLVAFAEGVVIFEPYEEYSPYYGLIEEEGGDYCLHTFEQGVAETALTLLAGEHSAVIEEAPAPGLAGLANPTQYFLAGEDWLVVKAFLMEWLPAEIPEETPA